MSAERAGASGCTPSGPWPSWRELAAAAEALGAAAILVADEGTDRDLYVTLAALAQRTRAPGWSAR